jgi:hypothetical protein
MGIGVPIDFFCYPDLFENAFSWRCSEVGCLLLQLQNIFVKRCLRHRLQFVLRFVLNDSARHCLCLTMR